MEFIQQVQQFFLEKIKETKSENKISKLVLNKLNHKPHKLTLKDVNHLMLITRVDEVVVDKTTIFTF